MPNTVPESVHPAAPAWSAEYLQEFLWRIVPGRSMRSMDDEVIAEFFREHPEHWEKIWALFTVEGAMPSNGLGIWFIYDAQLTICGHDLLVYLAEHFPQYRARIEQECVQALLRDYAPQNARVFSRAFEALTAVPKGLRGAERKQALVGQAQSYARHGALIPALLASPVATTAAVGAQMLQSVLQICAPSGGSAPAGLLPLTAGELQTLVAEALPVAAQLLFRREKKLMTAGLKVLELSVRAVPECAGEVSVYAQDAAEVLPLELRDRAAPEEEPPQHPARKQTPPRHIPAPPEHSTQAPSNRQSSASSHAGTAAARRQVEPPPPGFEAHQQSVAADRQGQNRQTARRSAEHSAASAHPRQPWSPPAKPTTPESAHRAEHRIAPDPPKPAYVQHRAAPSGPPSEPQRHARKRGRSAAHNHVATPERTPARSGLDTAENAPPNTPANHDRK